MPLDLMSLDRNCGRTSIWQRRAVHSMEDRKQRVRKGIVTRLFKLVSPRAYFLFLDPTF